MSDAEKKLEKLYKKANRRGVFEKAKAIHKSIRKKY